MCYDFYATVEDNTLYKLMLIFKWPCIVVWFGNLPSPFRIINGGGRILNGGGRILNSGGRFSGGARDIQTKPTQPNIFNQEKRILKEEKRIFNLNKKNEC